jgi:hypothetical protein
MLVPPAAAPSRNPLKMAPRQIAVRLVAHDEAISTMFLQLVREVGRLTVSFR